MSHMCSLLVGLSLLLLTIVSATFADESWAIVVPADESNHLYTSDMTGSGTWTEVDMQGQQSFQFITRIGKYVSGQGFTSFSSPGHLTGLQGNGDWEVDYPDPQQGYPVGEALCEVVKDGNVKATSNIEFVTYP